MHLEASNGCMFQAVFQLSAIPAIDVPAIHDTSPHWPRPPLRMWLRFYAAVDRLTLTPDMMCAQWRNRSRSLGKLSPTTASLTS
jgi:hypothetical protein